MTIATCDRVRYREADLKLHTTRVNATCWTLEPSERAKDRQSALCRPMATVDVARRFTANRELSRVPQPLN